ncbi:MAG: endonuclease/exonuclease/phosphatase family protein [Candidatus Cloacimonetes bacterium]|nr:endonuclease/exonuclease/phosphatase family protein [Candidatus Cloacimonadota bacterium]MCK9332021.1 endonuclease/exonuclease/phosphatase family protein [Candidatus Cloacimonadota bacterium]MDD4231894.1 endonuclease/exonuclease/phosphatase family protein [Candidatus Cloacimonadota bacterium]MDD4687654.1 endonuclease/exonuclease/phosphatase family protein [Candidatus Cloacimonadota bacterium]
MINKIELYGILIVVLLNLISCGKNQSLTPPPIEENPYAFGTESTLDIVTWNLKTFPLSNDTIQLLVEIIPALDVEIIAFQEINDASAFFTMANQLNDYQPLVYNATSSYRLAYLYKNSVVRVNDEYTVFNDDSNPFPRPPYVLDIVFEDTNYILINNHYKALGDNIVNENNEWDEEVRRRLASTMLEEYIDTNHPDDKVIVLGDLNDQIQEPEDTNVFLPFLDKPDEYYFATMPIALNPTLNTVSYPRYNSILDHILISNELFEDFNVGGSFCNSIRVENFDIIGGLSVYYEKISDHRPVGIRLHY